MIMYDYPASRKHVQERLSNEQNTQGQINFQRAEGKIVDDDRTSSL